MEELFKQLEKDPSGMANYEYIVNNTDSLDNQLPKLIENLRRADQSGQFLASTARFLHAVDPEEFDPYMETLVNLTIEKDKEHKYIGSLLQALWGEDYETRAEELQRSDDSFRRIYKRLYPERSIDNKGHLI